ncbi:MAG: TIGR02587 family membrane protein, partial [Leptolyngbyaceae cyanobacterium CRU_2_3]|nr:TIGR02587 family membrane protein [Leptolyngbyaceae cyanobacterium CRU_2_3]
LIMLFLLNRTDGFRQSQPTSPKQALIDSVESLAIGIVCALFMLFLLREITSATPLNEALGKIIFEAVPFSIGVALSRSMLSGGDKVTSSSDSESSGGESKLGQNSTLADIGATLVGTIIIAFNIAPTDEVPMLAAAVSPLWLLAVIIASLLISYGIVFAAGFTTQQQRHQHQGLFQSPIAETSMSYLISLVAAAFMLWFFHRLALTDPWTLWLKYSILLGLPATVGGAAGRLAV